MIFPLIGHQPVSHVAIRPWPVVLPHLKSSKCFGGKKRPEDDPLQKGSAVISMYDRAVTFQGDILVTFCPNGAMETVHMACIKYFRRACMFICVCRQPSHCSVRGSCGADDGALKSHVESLADARSTP